MTEPPMSDFNRLMTSVGWLMFHWCRVEDALTDDIRRLRVESEGDVGSIRVRGSFGERLREWRGLLSQKTRRRPSLAEAVAELANEMERLRRKRNLVAHDFAGASARPEDVEPYIWCAARDGAVNAEPIHITQSELTETIEALERCRTRIATLAVEQATAI